MTTKKVHVITDAKPARDENNAWRTARNVAVALAPTVAVVIASALIVRALEKDND